MSLTTFRIIPRNTLPIVNPDLYENRPFRGPVYKKGECRLIAFVSTESARPLKQRGECSSTVQQMMLIVSDNSLD